MYRSAIATSPGSFNIQELFQNSPAVQQVQDGDGRDEMAFDGLNLGKISPSGQAFLRFTW
jgi:hypothetical protein